MKGKPIVGSHRSTSSPSGGGRLMRASIARGSETSGSVHQVFLLSSASDARTIHLERPVDNKKTGKEGRRVALVYGHRYTRLDKLLSNPTNTDGIDL